ncbi:hypothetical protein ACIBTV_07735 [Micromonospora sp. NPDC049366]|uniref:hypothetical protein n=1 Tax=Micromonospora sp. NPDC049366 TaxID=3364271 RepID=UPI0037A79160
MSDLRPTSSDGGSPRPITNKWGRTVALSFRPDDDVADLVAQWIADCDRAYARHSEATVGESTRKRDLTVPWVADSRTFAIVAPPIVDGQSLADLVADQATFVEEYRDADLPVRSVAVIGATAPADFGFYLGRNGFPVRVYSASTSSGLVRPRTDATFPRGGFVVEAGGHFEVFGELTRSQADIITRELVQSHQLGWRYNASSTAEGSSLPLGDRAGTLALITALYTATVDQLAQDRTRLDLTRLIAGARRHERPDIVVRAVVDRLRAESKLDPVRYVADQVGERGSVPPHVRRLYTAIGHHNAAGVRPVRFATGQPLLSDDATRLPTRLVVPSAEARSSALGIVASWLAEAAFDRSGNAEAPRLPVARVGGSWARHAAMVKEELRRLISGNLRALGVRSVEAERLVDQIMSPSRPGSAGDKTFVEVTEQNTPPAVGFGRTVTATGLTAGVHTDGVALALFREAVRRELSPGEPAQTPNRADHRAEAARAHDLNPDDRLLLNEIVRTSGPVIAAEYAKLLAMQSVRPRTQGHALTPESLKERLDNLRSSAAGGLDVPDPTDQRAAAASLVTALHSGLPPASAEAIRAGWAPVNSLTELVRIVGRPARPRSESDASSNGPRVGLVGLHMPDDLVHVMAVIATTGGVRWVHPSSTTLYPAGELPDDVRGAQAAEAVLIEIDGTVQPPAQPVSAEPTSTNTSPEPQPRLQAVALGGDVLRMLEDLPADADERDRDRISAALQFGNSVAAHLRAEQAGQKAAAADTPGHTAGDRSVATLVELMALLHVQLTAMLGDQANPGGSTPPALAVAAGQPMSNLWEATGPDLRDFFIRHAPVVRNLYEASFDALFPNFRADLAAERELPAGDEVNLWTVPLLDHTTGLPVATAGQMVEELLHPDPSRHRLDAGTGGFTRPESAGTTPPPGHLLLQIREPRRRNAPPARDITPPRSHRRVVMSDSTALPSPNFGYDRRPELSGRRSQSGPSSSGLALPDSGGLGGPSQLPPPMAPRTPVEAPLSVPIALVHLNTVANLLAGGSEVADTERERRWAERVVADEIAALFASDLAGGTVPASALGALAEVEPVAAMGGYFRLVTHLVSAAAEIARDGRPSVPVDLLPAVPAGQLFAALPEVAARFVASHEQSIRDRIIGHLAAAARGGTADPSGERLAQNPTATVGDLVGVFLGRPVPEIDLRSALGLPGPAVPAAAAEPASVPVQLLTTGPGGVTDVLEHGNAEEIVREFGPDSDAAVRIGELARSADGREHQRRLLAAARRAQAGELGAPGEAALIVLGALRDLAVEQPTPHAFRSLLTAAEASTVLDAVGRDMASHRTPTAAAEALSILHRVSDRLSRNGAAGSVGHPALARLETSLPPLLEYLTTTAGDGVVVGDPASPDPASRGTPLAVPRPPGALLGGMQRSNRSQSRWLPPSSSNQNPPLVAPQPPAPVNWQQRITVHLNRILETPPRNVTQFPRSIGPDWFRITEPEAPPPFLQGVEIPPPMYVADFLRRLDMLNPRSFPPSFSNLAAASTWQNQGAGRHTAEQSWVKNLVARRNLGADAVSRRSDVPKVVHSIWLGDPLTRARESTSEFMDTVQVRAQRMAAVGIVTVLWTDIPRESIQRAIANPGAANSHLQRQVVEMVEWGIRSNVIFVSITEVSARFPMRLQRHFQMELAKQSGLGWGAASDIARHEILYRFGGVYIDGDNPLPSHPTAAIEFYNEIQSLAQDAGLGMRVIAHLNTVNNDLFMATAGHPFTRLYLEAIERNYERVQVELIPREAHEHDPDPKVNFDRAVRRRSIMHRVGPEVMVGLIVELGLELADLPNITTIDLDFGNAWVPDVTFTARRHFGDDEVLQVARRVTATLVRGLYNIPGLLQLTAVATTVNGLPDPPGAWRAIIGVILRHPQLVRLVRSVAYQWTEVAHDLVRTTASVVIPADVVQLLNPTGGARDHNQLTVMDVSPTTRAAVLARQAQTSMASPHPANIGGPVLTLPRRTPGGPAVAGQFGRSNAGTPRGRDQRGQHPFAPYPPDMFGGNTEAFPVEIDDGMARGLDAAILDRRRQVIAAGNDPARDQILQDLLHYRSSWEHGPDADRTPTAFQAGVPDPENTLAAPRPEATARSVPSSGSLRGALAAAIREDARSANLPSTQIDSAARWWVRTREPVGDSLERLLAAVDDIGRDAEGPILAPGSRATILSGIFTLLSADPSGESKVGKDMLEKIERLRTTLDARTQAAADIPSARAHDALGHIAALLDAMTEATSRAPSIGGDIGRRDQRPSLAPARFDASPAASGRDRAARFAAGRRAFHRPRPVAGRSPEELHAIADDIALRQRGPTDCVALAADYGERLYGRRPGFAASDEAPWPARPSAPSHADARRRMLSDGFWTHVSGSEAVESAVSGIGLGGSAFVIATRPGDDYDHALVLHATSAGSRWVDLQADRNDRVLAPGDRPVAVAESIELHVALTDSTGRALPWPDGVATSSWSTASALLDPPSNRAVGTFRSRFRERPSDSFFRHLTDRARRVQEARDRSGRQPVAERQFGLDLFGFRDPSPTPAILRGVRLADERTELLSSWFRRLDVNASVATLPLEPTPIWVEEDFDSERWWPDHQPLQPLPPLPSPLEMPLFIHVIWLGSPVTETNPATAVVRRNVEDLSRTAAAEGFTVILWTDVPRERFRERTGEVAEMGRWMRRHGIVGLRPDEVFHEDEQMTLAAEYRLEAGRGTAAGYAAASDILRLELSRFGGIYTDGDNPVHSLTGLRELLRPPGFGVHANPPGLNNSALFMPRGHPFMTRYLEMISSNYRLRQDELYPEAHFVGNSLADHHAHYIQVSEQSYRRRSTMERTGPITLASVAMSLGIPNDQIPRIPSTSLAVGAANTWQSVVPRRLHPEQATHALENAVSGLVWGLTNRRGDLDLVSVAPLIQGLQDPDAGWEGAVRFIHSVPRLRLQVRTVTYAYLERPEELALFQPAEVTELRLPDPVRALLGLPPHGTLSESSGVWRRAAFGVPVPSDTWSYLTVPFVSRQRNLTQPTSEMHALVEHLRGLGRLWTNIEVWIEGGGSREGSPAGMDRANSVRNGLMRLAGELPITWHEPTNRGGGDSAGPRPLPGDESRSVVVWWTATLNMPSDNDAVSLMSFGADPDAEDMVDHPVPTQVSNLHRLAQDSFEQNLTGRETLVNFLRTRFPYGVVLDRGASGEPTFDVNGFVNDALDGRIPGVRSTGTWAAVRASVELAGRDGVVLFEPDQFRPAGVLHAAEGTETEGIEIWQISFSPEGPTLERLSEVDPPPRRVMVVDRCSNVRS